jgi:hypothetical protein
MLHYVAFLAMVQRPWKWVLQVWCDKHWPAIFQKKITQKNSKALEQSNQSHPPSSVQVTSQPHWEVARAHL